MTLSREQRDAFEAEEQRRLSPEEFAARASAPMTAHERESFWELVTWFRRRYPTAGERLRAQRERLARWRANELRPR